jgi:hypothetical protein
MSAMRSFRTYCPHRSATWLALNFATAALLTLLTAAAAFAQDKTKGAAPAYPGASVTDFDGKVQAPGYAGAGDYYTKDSATKVKAFYEPKTGPFTATKSGALYVTTELLPFKQVSYGEAGTYAYTTAGVTIFDSKAPDFSKLSDAELKKWAHDAKYITHLANSVDWGEDQPGMERMSAADREQVRRQTQAMSGKHSVQEFRALMGQYGYLAKAFFKGREDRDLEERYEKRSSEIHDQREKNREQQSKADEAKFKQDMDRKMAESRENARKERAAPGSVYKQSPEEQEFSRVMERKPKIRDAYYAATQEALAAMQTRDMEKMQAATEKADKIIRSDKEVSAAYDKMKAAQDKQGQAQQAQAQANQQQQMSQMYGSMGADQEAAGWNNWKAFLVDLDKMAFRTKIRIERSLDFDWHDEAKVPGSVVRGSEAIAKQKQIGAQRVAEFCAKMKGGCGQGHEADDQARGSAAANDGGSKGGSAPASGKPAPAPEKKDDAVDSAKQAAQEGVNFLKKLF